MYETKEKKRSEPNQHSFLNNGTSQNSFVDNRPEANSVKSLQLVAKLSENLSGAELSIPNLGIQDNTQVAQRVIDAASFRIQINEVGEDHPEEITTVQAALLDYQASPGDATLADLIRANAIASESAPSTYSAIIVNIRKAYAGEISDRMVRAQKEWPGFDKQQVEVDDTTKKHASVGKDAVDLAAQLIKSGNLGEAQMVLLDFVNEYWIAQTEEKAALKKFTYLESSSPTENASNFFSFVKSSDPRYYPNKGIKIPYMQASREQWAAVEGLSDSAESADIAAFKSATFGVMTILEEVMHLVQEHMGIWHSPDTGKFAKSGVELDWGEGITDFDEADIVAWIIDQDFPDWAIEKWGVDSAYSMRTKFMTWKGL